MCTSISRRGFSTLLAVSMLLLAGLGTAPQAGAATIYVCAKKKTGAMRLVSKSTKCKHGENKLSWSTQGPAGPTGPAGPGGAKGAEGSPGAPAPSTLPSGQSESGEFAALAYNTAFLYDAVTLPIPLAADIPESHVEYTESGKSTNCSGPGHANPGYVCLYSFAHSEIELPVLALNSEAAGKKPETGRFGFLIEWETVGLGSTAWDEGSWTVTAP